MPEITTDQKNIAILLAMQKGEITEYQIYLKIAATTKDEHNQEILTRIANEELTHYGIWKRYTKQDVSPDSLRVWFYYLIARLLGLTFAIKLMEGVEKRAQSADLALPFTIPEIAGIL
jgi:rubrerythrin